jgi:hypothetical protein
VRTLELIRHLDGLQDFIGRDPLVLRTASIADVVKSLHKVFNADDPRPYRLPDTQELLAQLMFLGESPAFERFTDRALSKALLMVPPRRRLGPRGRWSATPRPSSRRTRRPRA